MPPSISNVPKKYYKDGIVRNFYKLADELRYLSKEMPRHLIRWLKAPWDSHAYFNLFVESRRLSPYFVGHIDALLYPAAIVALIYLYD